jgi:hypothetical protein
MNMDPNPREREVDHWLDAALSHYSKSEPRYGLEGRVLANLQSERRRIASRSRWWRAAGIVTTIAVTTAAIALAVWLGRGERVQTPGRTGNTAQLSPEIRHSGVNAEAKAEAPAEAHPPRNAADQAATKTPPPPSPPRIRHRPDVTETAKLERFPAPAPLSEQEKLLARYVQQFPQRAELMARAQADLRQQIELEMAAPWPEAVPTGREQ